jgi:outer membrane lipoprotein SlyB
MKGYIRLTLALTLLALLGTLAAMGEVNARIPAGTSVQVRITENLNSETANVGQEFHGTLAAPVVANGRKLFPKGASVTGEVVNVERSGRLSTPGELHLSLRTIRTGGRTYAVSVETIVLKGESHAKSNVTKIGGGAALGALIGAAAGGGKGAGIGAGVGAAAGTGVAAGTGKKPAEVQSETLLAWVAQDVRAGEVSQEQGPTQSSGNYEAEAEEHHGNKHYSRDDDQAENYVGRGPSGFSYHERQIIGDCFANDRASLPPGLAKKNHLPPGLERQLQRNGTLPPGLQKRVQPLPEFCATRLPRLPRDWARVVLSGRIILLDPQQRIVDLFWLGRD